MFDYIDNMLKHRLHGFLTHLAELIVTNATFVSVEAVAPLAQVYLTTKIVNLVQYQHFVKIWWTSFDYNIFFYMSW